MTAPAVQIVDAHTLLIGTLVLMLAVTAVMVAITYWSLDNDAHTPAGLREDTD